MAAGGPRLELISTTRSPIPTTVAGWKGRRYCYRRNTHTARSAAPFIAAEMENDDNDDAASFLSCLVKWVASGLRHVRKMLVSRVTSTITYVQCVMYVPYRYVKIKQQKSKDRQIDRHCAIFQSEREMGTMGRGHANERQRK